MIKATKTIFLEKNLVDLFDISSKMETPPTDFFVKKKGWFLHLTRCFVFTFFVLFSKLLFALEKKMQKSFYATKRNTLFWRKRLKYYYFFYSIRGARFDQQFFDASQKAVKKRLKKRFVDFSDISSKMEAPLDFFLICLKRRMQQKF